ncbi:hypothetical protein PanWU01x14_231650 [Parasponia andersonii]|uniref:Uncharacterized protein n=1 Tax=Parasponia andersonii TaxID=3476 RepID=A0A2P5BK86_PARAD|nr:hypothetical protein PanWU01x14_231650 [Parasponia andersonii]
MSFLGDFKVFSKLIKKQCLHTESIEGEENRHEGSKVRRFPRKLIRNSNSRSKIWYFPANDGSDGNKTLASGYWRYGELTSGGYGGHWRLGVHRQHLMVAMVFGQRDRKRELS